MFKSMFAQQKAKPAPAPPIVMNNAFWAAQAANAKKGALQRAEQEQRWAVAREEEAKENAAFEEYRKSPQYAKTMKNLNKSEKENRKEKEAENYRKNPYGGITGVRLRKTRRARKTS